MKCSLLGGLCLFCLLLAGSILVILLSQASSCPSGTFYCSVPSNSSSNSSYGVCLPRRLLCDGHKDCPDGSDEDRVRCHDIHGELDSFRDRIRPPASQSTFNLKTNCSANLESYPAGCKCLNFSWLDCSNGPFKSVPQVDLILHRIFLMNNSIRRLTAKDLGNYNLDLIQMEFNQLELIDEDAFSRQRYLKRLYLKGNRLSDLKPGTFNHLQRLEWLFLEQNQLQDTNMAVFSNLTSLWWLNISHNLLTLKIGNVFPRLESLQDLFLNENRIEAVYNDTVASLSNLMLLDLRHNLIRHVDHDAFVSLTKLKLLDLSYNLLEYIPEGIFRSQNNLTNLRLGFNPILYLSTELFQSLSNLRSIGLQDVDIDNISMAMFEESPHLEWAYFKSFTYCTYLPRIDKCKPLSDGVSSFTDLISHRVHRAFLWIIGVLTILGNILVLGGRGLARTENRILAMFVKNLAAADLCIGIYLLCIGERDITFRDSYNQHAHQWMTSWECTVLRLLAVSTSEVSLLLLTFMSVERFVSISHPFGERTLNFRTAFISTTLIWLIGLALALIPVLYWNQLGTHHGSNGLCFPLHIHEPSALGWQYSAFLYIGINGSCVLVIVGVYTALFISIRQTRSSTPLAPNEIEIAVRFFFIVFTDCLCWMPTILLKIMALSNVYIPADLYAWLVVFVLPVNSAINPWLYTFTTPTFRATVRDFYRRVAVDWASAASNSITMTSRSGGMIGVRSSLSFRHHSSTTNAVMADEDSGRPQVDVVLLNDGNSSGESMLGPLTAPATAKWRGGIIVGSKPTRSISSEPL